MNKSRFASPVWSDYRDDAAIGKSDGNVTESFYATEGLRELAALQSHDLSNA
jgi:hypothetical protein